MERKVYTENNKIRLLYASITDQKLIYDMLFEERSIWSSMLKHEHDFSWDEFNHEGDTFFTTTPGMNHYLLIEYENQIIGSLSHCYHHAIIPNFELDIWLRAEKYTNKGLGSSAILLLIHSLYRDYSVKTFIMRPWTLNHRAIRAYEKCGFRYDNTFDSRVYYGEHLVCWGGGDYPQEENYNMVLTLPLE